MGTGGMDHGTHGGARLGHEAFQLDEQHWREGFYQHGAPHTSPCSQRAGGCDDKQEGVTMLDATACGGL